MHALRLEIRAGLSLRSKFLITSYSSSTATLNTLKATSNITSRLWSVL
jgi:hypothetical protein